MVCSSVDRAESVGASGKTSSYISCENTSLSGIVQSLEESKFSRVGWGSLVKSLQSLDDNMRMADDLTLSVQLLRSCEVVLLGVDEGTGLHVIDSHANGKRGVGCDGVTILGVRELGGWHIVL
jgi:hypothetical protein